MMSSESAARRLLLAAGGLAAVGLASLGLTVTASDGSAPVPAAPEPSLPTSFATSTQLTETLVPATSTATVLPTTVVAATAPETTITFLEDGQVWVYNRSQNRVGLFDIGAGRLTWASRPLAELFGSLDYQVNGGMAALYEKDTRKLWVGPANELVRAWFPERPDQVLASGSRVVITATGKVIVVNADGWYELSLDPSRRPDTGGGTSAPPVSAHPVPKQFNEDPGMTTVSAVGDKLVYLSSIGLLFTDGQQVQIAGVSPVLQLAGPDSDSVLVASSAGLFEVNLVSGVVTTLAEGFDGTPARPARVGSCVYGAWAGQEPQWLKACNDQNVLTTPIPGAAGDTLVLRFAGDRVALNEIATGAVWVEEDGAFSKASIEWAEVATEVRS